MKETYRERMHAPPRNAARGAIFVACCIARAFGERPMTWQQLCDRFGMSRATAYRWVRAWKDANGRA